MIYLRKFRVRTGGYEQLNGCRIFICTQGGRLGLVLTQKADCRVLQATCTEDSAYALYYIALHFSHLPGFHFGPEISSSPVVCCNWYIVMTLPHPPPLRR